MADNGIPRLSLRETEVLKWMARGKGAWETAVLMGISERTVKFHLQSIYRKLQVSNCAHAVAEAIRAGLI